MYFKKGLFYRNTTFLNYARLILNAYNIVIYRHDTAYFDHMSVFYGLKCTYTVHILIVLWTLYAYNIEFNLAPDNGPDF